MNFLFNLVVLAVAAQAAQIPITEPAMTRPVLYPRQTPPPLSSAVYRTVGYRSLLVDKGVIVCMFKTVPSSTFHVSSLIYKDSTFSYLDYNDNPSSNYLIITSSGDFWNSCTMQWETSLSRYYRNTSSSCTLWTACSSGYLWDANTRSRW
jgi:hypothetical protein